MLFTNLIKHSDLKVRFMRFRSKFLPFNKPCFVGDYFELLIESTKAMFIIAFTNEHSSGSNFHPLVLQ